MSESVSGNGLYRERGTETERCASAFHLLLGLRVRCALAEVCHAAFHFSGKRSAQMNGAVHLSFFRAESRSGRGFAVERQRSLDLARS